jgi:hypothetical protein
MDTLKKCFLLLVIFGFSSCQPAYLNGVDSELVPNVEAALLQSGENCVELERALLESNHSHRNGMAFLIAHMPKSDADTLTADFLIKQVDLAYKTKELFAWTKELPDSIFLNEVLPYASLDETRENWREPFLEMLQPLVKDCKDMHAAVDVVNNSLQELVKVKYSTKRKKANQSPAESMMQGLASCSGLSVLLTDAFRAVGIPSRIAGTPLWVTKEGNHSWCEVWIDGKWYFTEYYPAGLNKGWFLHRAGAADKSDPIHWIYATSFKKRAIHFPMTWSKENKDVSGVDVSDRYIHLYKLEQELQTKGVELIVSLYKNKDSKESSEGRIAQDVVIRNNKGEIIANKKTVGPTADMNDYLMVRVPKSSEYTIEYKDQAGLQKKQISVGDEKLKVELFFEK